MAQRLYVFPSPLSKSENCCPPTTNTQPGNPRPPTQDFSHTTCLERTEEIGQKHKIVKSSIPKSFIPVSSFFFQTKTLYNPDKAGFPLRKKEVRHIVYIKTLLMKI